MENYTIGCDAHKRFSQFTVLDDQARVQALYQFTRLVGSITLEPDTTAHASYRVHDKSNYFSHRSFPPTKSGRFHVKHRGSVDGI
jgi:hypothetical protein